MAWGRLKLRNEATKRSAAALWDAVNIPVTTKGSSPEGNIP
jgi:hypothetical protein